MRYTSLSLLQNPFVRGFEGFSIERLAIVTSDTQFNLYYRKIHESPKTGQDWNLLGQNCRFDQELVYLLDDSITPTDPDTRSGQIRSVIYSISGHVNNYQTHVGDSTNMMAAESIVKTLSFTQGHYERCWTISTQHLPSSSFSILQERFYDRNPENDLLEISPMENGESIGIQFFQAALPVRPDNPEADYEAYGLKLIHLLGEKTPEHLIELLSLAYVAGTRVLIFSDNAPLLRGLPTFEQ